MIKKITLLTAIASLAFAPSLWAQDDDMYFVPRKKTAEEKAQEAKAKTERMRHYVGDTYYIGSNRNVDEYNRRSLKSSVVDVTRDSAAAVSDIIDFQIGDGRYPDSVAVDTVVDYSIYNPDEYTDDDYVYSRRIGRWYAYGDPWYRHHWYNDPWYWNYYGFYDPWVYSYCYSGYYNPYYWGAWYGGWYWDEPWWYGGGWYGPDYWYGHGYYGYGYGGHGGYGGRIYAGGSHGTQGHGSLRPHDYGYSTAMARSAAGRNVAAHTTHAVSRGVSSASRSDNASVMRSSAGRSGSFSGYRNSSSNSNANSNSSPSRSYSTSNSSYSSSHSSSGGGGHSGGGFSGGGGRSGGGGFSGGGRR